MSKYPNANVVSRALRRDAGVITMPRDRLGYHVTGNGDYPAHIHVDIDNSPNLTNRRRRATEALAETLTAHGWTVEATDGDSVNVTRVPSASEALAHMVTVVLTVTVSVNKAAWIANYDLEAEEVDADVRTLLPQVLDHGVTAFLETSGNVGVVEVKLSE